MTSRSFTRFLEDWTATTPSGLNRDLEGLRTAVSQRFSMVARVPTTDLVSLLDALERVSPESLGDASEGCPCFVFCCKTDGVEDSISFVDAEKHHKVVAQPVQ